MLHPSCFEDLIAMLALYRPGPLGSGMVDEFIKRKHGEVPVVYPHPSLESCLKDTYGVIVYQEQVMQIAQIIANYTLGGADLLRRAMGKKKAEAMAKQRSIFVKGAAGNNISEEKANEIFDLMEKFAAYGFNKSHSAAYAQISYYTAWLKVHHTCAFMAALLTSEMGNQEKLLKYISCCKDRGVDVLPPSVNYSQRSFSAKDGKIVFGLGGIKNVGDEAIQEIEDGCRQHHAESDIGTAVESEHHPQDPADEVQGGDGIGYSLAQTHYLMPSLALMAAGTASLWTTRSMLLPATNASEAYQMPL